MSVMDRDMLRGAFGRYITGVTVVTARAPDGAAVGFTANSFTSVSLDPPLLLVCPGAHLSSFPVFERASHFAVSVLAEDQGWISTRFARPCDDRFSGVGHEVDAQGVPLIAGRSAGFSCAMEQRIPAGDHLILIGRVIRFDRSDAPGLGYAGGTYFSLRSAEAPAADTTGNTGG